MRAFFAFSGRLKGDKGRKTRHAQKQTAKLQETLHVVTVESPAT